MKGRQGASRDPAVTTSATKRRVLLLFLSLVFLATACATPYRAARPSVRPNPFNPVYTVAVLPMYNATNDVGGPREVRKGFHEMMQGRHYSVMPLEVVDQILLEQMGITLGDQAELTTPEEIGKTLGVDGVVYGYLLYFDDITTGVYNVKQVKAGFKLVDARTGATVWSKGLGVKSVIAGSAVGVGVTALKELTASEKELIEAIEGARDIPGIEDWRYIRVLGTEKIEEAAVLSLGEMVFTKLLGVHLRPETDAMLGGIVSTLPAGPGSSRLLRETPVEIPERE